MIPTLIPIPKGSMDVPSMLSLMRQHGLSDWQLRITRSKWNVGTCRHRSKIIEISCYQPDGCWRDTLLHEIAHAVLPAGIGHGPLWVQKCIEIGAKPNAKVRTAVHPDLTYQYECWECKKIVLHSIGKLRRPDRRRTGCCRSFIQLVKEPIKCS